MKFTDVFIKRPVMGVALSILLVVIGLFSLNKLTVRDYPQLTSANIKVTVTQSGVSAESIKNFITVPLEQELAKVEDIDYISSSSTQGSSTITLFFKPGSNLDTAFNNVIASVNAVKGTLPSTADDPVIQKDTGRAVNPLYISFQTDKLTTDQLADYLTRNIKPLFYTVDGVANVSSFSPGLYLLITLDPEKIAKYNLSPSVVSSVITANNLQVSAGSLKSTYRVLTNSVDGTVKSVDELENLVITTVGDSEIRLKDIASVKLDAVEGQSVSTINNKAATILGFELTPDANGLSVVKNLLKTYEETVKPALPNYIKSSVTYDGTVAVREAVYGVAHTVFEAVIIVMAVMLLFLGSFKSLFVPIVAIPISIIANFLFLYIMGYSINLVTLLAIILAIGLVVDDAIVVLENIHRHITLGETPFRAAIIGTREIAAPVIVMTFTLAVVFTPIALTSGATGPIYKEFAITLAGSVVLSGIVSLTLSPMLVAALFRNYNSSKVSKFEHIVESTLEKATNGYSSLLDIFLQQKKLAGLLIIAVVVAIISLPKNITSELTPTEDRGIFVAFQSVPANSTLDYALLQQKEIYKDLDNIPELTQRLSIVTPSQIINISPLKNDRDRSQMEITADSAKYFTSKPGVKPNLFNFPEIDVPGAGFFNFAVSIQSSDDFKTIIPYAKKFLAKAVDDGVLLIGNLGVDYDQSKLNINIDREKAAQYGVQVAQIAQSLASYLSGSVAARVSLDGQVYKVITQLPDADKNSTRSLSNFYVTNSKGQNIPLSEIVSYDVESQPSSLPRLNQLNAVSVNGMSLRSSGELTEWIKENFPKYFPSSYTYSLTGQLRTYEAETTQNNTVYVLAFILIFLVLAIQFNSWRDGIVIMVTVPLAISGSLLFLFIFSTLKVPGASMNLYTKIGIMTLVGLITKHGILMCQVAKEEQIHNGMGRRAAIVHAAKLRFRPILMTTLAMVAGLIPLLMSSGTGSSARFSIAITIVAGLSIGTLFTLFVLPMVYTWIGKVHKPEPVFDESVKPISQVLEQSSYDHEVADGRSLDEESEAKEEAAEAAKKAEEAKKAAEAKAEDTKTLTNKDQDDKDNNKA